MDNSDTLNIRIAIQDPSVSSEELQQIVQIIAAELEPKAESVSFVPVQSTETGNSAVIKGEQFGSILDVKINFETLRSFSKWLSNRFMDTPTIAEFTYKDGHTEATLKINAPTEDHEEITKNCERFIATVRDRNK